LHYPLALGFLVNGQQYLQIVGITEIRMVAVCTFHDIQLLGGNADRICKGEGAAIEWTVRERLSCF
jgi:hypothetical protein